MSATTYLLASIAALPFLPPGKGGLILILGGLSMLAFALFVLRVSPRRMPAGVGIASGPIGQAAAMAFTDQAPASSPASPGTGWQQHLPRLAAAHGLPETRILEGSASDAMVLVTHCRSCRYRKRVCRSERRRLQRAARRVRRRAQVREVACRIKGHSACVFHVDMRWR